MIEEIKRDSCQNQPKLKQLVLERFIQPYEEYGKSGPDAFSKFISSNWKNALEYDSNKYSINELVLEGWTIKSVDKAFFSYVERIALSGGERTTVYGIETIVLEKEEK